MDETPWLLKISLIFRSFLKIERVGSNPIDNMDTVVYRVHVDFVYCFTFVREVHTYSIFVNHELIDLVNEQTTID